MQTPNASQAPLILFSGMGADARVFAPQRDAFPQLVVPEWIQPKTDESLAESATRFAGVIDPHKPCLIGGASFGGFVAMEMCRHLNALGCILIGSVRSPAEFPTGLRALHRAAPIAHAVPFEIFSWIAAAMKGVSSPLTSIVTRSFLGQIADLDADFLRWASCALLTWNGPRGESSVPVHQIHAARDRILPHRYTLPDVLLAGAGHLLTLSHPREVNTFIKKVIDTAGAARHVS